MKKGGARLDTQHSATGGMYASRAEPAGDGRCGEGPQASPGSLSGLLVRKLFPGLGWFRGTVVEYKRADGMYLVEYEGGLHAEELDAEETQILCEQAQEYASGVPANSRAFSAGDKHPSGQAGGDVHSDDALPCAPISSRSSTPLLEADDIARQGESSMSQDDTLQG